MQFAYLVRSNSQGFGGLLVQAPSLPDVPDVALVKARTYIAYLLDNKRLSFSEDTQKSWVYYQPLNSMEGPFPAIELPETNDEIVAVIPVMVNKPTWRQPGIAVIKNTLEVKTLFDSTFLESSREWLKRNPNKLHELDQRSKMQQGVAA